MSTLIQAPTWSEVLPAVFLRILSVLTDRFGQQGCGAPALLVMPGGGQRGRCSA